MSRRLIECVPNFSEGCDTGKVDAIVNAIAAAPGVSVLARESDPDHNRSVVTFAGPPEAVAAAAVRGIGIAVERIDLTRHTGVHPRIGAADVVPFVPIENVTLAECAEIARQAGEEVWRLFRVPVYFYEAAARRPEYERLEDIRRGGFQYLRDHLADRPPDLGDAIHPTAGACVIGARKLLVAFNVNLTTGDADIARRIAVKIRESSGGLAALKAIGVPLASRGMAQVAMNLVDFERTGMYEALEAVRVEAALLGVGIAASQIVGLVPRKALDQAAAAFLACENFSGDRVLENRIEAAAPRRAFDEVLEHLALPASPMGGGSAAALAAAMASALGHAAARISKLPCGRFLEHRGFFADAAQRDARAFEDVMLARNAGESERQAAWRSAAAVPTEVAERARALDRDLNALAGQADSRVKSDVRTAQALTRAARAGAVATAKSNLESIADEAFRKEIEDRLQRRLP
jgi:glutamate formiminotransferase / formiminotetrahydrofolate cyclodeaminase